MADIIAAEIYKTIAAKLGQLDSSDKIFNMANGARVRSQGRWTGEVDVRGLKQECKFKVFPAKGSFKILLGEPFLQKAKVVHNLANNTIAGVNVDGMTAKVVNKNKPARNRPFFEVLEVEECEEEEGKEAKKGSGSGKGKKKEEEDKERRKRREAAEMEYLEEVITGKRVLEKIEEEGEIEMESEGGLEEEVDK